MIDYKQTFKELKQEVREAGLLKRVPKRGIFEMLLTVTAFLGSLFFAPEIHPVLLGFMFTIIFTRFVFISHDLLHAQYFQSKIVNRRIGYFFASTMLGLSGLWWDLKHNINHHTWTNCENKDKDILALDGTFTPTPGNNALVKFMPHTLFWGALFFMYPAFIAQSYNFAIRRKNYLELFFMLLHIPLFYGTLFFLLDTSCAVTTLLVMFFSLSIWLSMGFITNHLGCEVLDESKCNDISWMELQLRTSRNVRGGAFVHWFFGGLNTQIEHHLYPKAPRFSLLKAAKITEDYCIKHNIAYHNVSVMRAYIEIDRAITKTRG